MVVLVKMDKKWKKRADKEGWVSTSISKVLDGQNNWEGRKPNHKQLDTVDRGISVYMYNLVGVKQIGCVFTWVRTCEVWIPKPCTLLPHNQWLNDCITMYKNYNPNLWHL